MLKIDNAGDKATVIKNKLIIYLIIFKIGNIKNITYL